jgi:hypothetical protein
MLLNFPVNDEAVTLLRSLVALFTIGWLTSVALVTCRIIFAGYFMAYVRS